MRKYFPFFSDTCRMSGIWQKKVSEIQEKKCQKHKKDLTSFQCHDRLVWRMEVGLFFMPKIHQPIKAVSKKQRERGGSFAHKNYIGVYGM